MGVLSSLHAAAQSGDLDEVAAIIKRLPPGELTPMKHCSPNPFALALEYGHTAVARLLLAHGAGVDNEYAETPLHYAARWGNKDIVELLLAGGADVNARDKNGWTPLHWAPEKAGTDVVELLLAHGAEVNAKNSSGLTPLHRALERNRKDLVRLLLTNGADANARDLGKGGTAPLHLAVESSREKDLVELLVAQGADVNAKGARGDSPLHSLAQRPFSGHKDVVDVLLARGAELNAKNDVGFTPLTLSAFEGNIEAVEVLLSHGADVSVRSDRGWTPLHAAVSGGHEYKIKNVVELLLAHGADANAKDPYGNTPLHWATYLATRAQPIYIDSFKATVELLRPHTSTECSPAGSGSKTELIEMIEGIEIVTERWAAEAIAATQRFGIDLVKELVTESFFSRLPFNVRKENTVRAISIRVGTAIAGHSFAKWLAESIVVGRQPAQMIDDPYKYGSFGMWQDARQVCESHGIKFR